jgi:uncharacterized protein (TIGR03435 family)
MASNNLPTRTLLCLIAAYMAIHSTTLMGQQSPDKPSAASPTFDVVSIKPNNSGHRGGAWGVYLNEYSAKNTAFAYVILQAYLGDLSASLDRLKGAPSWVTADPYDITAKVDDATANSWKGLRQARQVAIAAPMLRAMLEDRCKLVVHTVPTEIQGYALVPVQGPLKLKVYQPNEPLPKSYGRLGGDWMIAYSEPGSDFQPYTEFLNITMSEFTEFMSMGGTPIIDQTGLTGNYDFKLPRFDTPPPSAEGGTVPTPAPRPDTAHLFDWRAAGLELKPIKVPSFDVVIDHIERPSQN